MEWNDISLILEIARTGSLSAAAAELSTSKPTISRRIAHLEQKSNVRIFKRSPHGTALTDDGQQLLCKAMKIEEEVLDFERTLRALGSKTRQPITIEMSEGVASYLMTPVVARQELGPLGIAARRLSLDLPTIKMVPSATSGANIQLCWLPKGALPGGSSSDKVVRLVDISFVPFVSSRCQPPAHGPRLSFDDIADSHQLITLDGYQRFKDEDGWATWHRQTATGRHGAISTQWSASLGHLTVNGAGIGLLPTYSVMYTNELSRLDLPVPDMVASLWMLASDDALSIPRIKDCFVKIKRLFAEASWCHPNRR